MYVPFPWLLTSFLSCSTCLSSRLVLAYLSVHFLKWFPFSPSTTCWILLLASWISEFFSSQIFIPHFLLLAFLSQPPFWILSYFTSPLSVSPSSPLINSCHCHLCCCSCCLPCGPQWRTPNIPFSLSLKKMSGITDQSYRIAESVPKKK